MSDSHPLPRESRRATFGLGSLMLTMTLVAILLGLFVIDPGLGIGGLLLITPALVRTVVRVKKGKRQGESLDPQQKAVAFLGSLGVMIATAMAMGSAFFATCWGFFYVGMTVGEGMGQAAYEPIGMGLVFGLSTGFIATVVCGGVMIRWLWPIRLEDRPGDRGQ